MDPKYFSANPYVMSGAWCISGTHILVRTVSRLVEAGYSDDQIKSEYPALDIQQIQAVRNWGGKGNVVTRCNGSCIYGGNPSECPECGEFSDAGRDCAWCPLVAYAGVALASLAFWAALAKWVL